MRFSIGLPDEKPICCIGFNARRGSLSVSVLLYIQDIQELLESPLPSLPSFKTLFRLYAFSYASRAEIVAERVVPYLCNKITISYKMGT